MGLRERQRRQTLITVQRSGVALFVDHGFDAVKVADIAEAVDIAPSTLYRYFPTKESIVLWDEHESAYGDALVVALQDEPPFAALRRAFGEVLARFDDTSSDDIAFELDRVRLIVETPTIMAAAASADARDRAALAQLVVAHLDEADLHTAELIAGAALLSVTWAFERWQAVDAATPLSEFLDRAFDRLAHLEALR